MKGHLPQRLIFAAIVAVLAVVLGSASAQQPQADQGKATEPAKATDQTKPAAAASRMQNYVIGSDDILAINVWKEPELSRQVPVRPDGKISVPLLGDVQAAGLTPMELQSNLEKQWQKFVSAPEVTVIVHQVNSQKFNVVGQVEHPGTFPLTQPITVLDAIAAAGGFRDFAKTSKIYILRQQPDGSQTRLPFNYKQVIKGNNMSQNVRLEPRDVVVVP